MADVLDSARRGYEEKVARSIKDMEIPDFKTWSATAFVQDKAKNWSDAYGAGLERNEAAFEKLFVQLAQLRGQISTRKINDSPQTAEGPELAVLSSLKQHTDIYVAEWRDAITAADANGEAIGYFFFLDGKFRWDSTVTLPRPRSTSSAIAPPRLVKRVDPIYPLEARTAGVGGPVTLRIKVQIDGRPLFEGVVSGDERLVQAAKDAVLQWHFEPASVNDKPIEVEMTVEVDFVLMRAP
jgi:TonB family protein